MIASVSSAGAVRRAGLGAGKSWRTQRTKPGSVTSCQPSAFSTISKACCSRTHSIFSCSSAVAISASVARANSLGESSSSAPAPLIAVASSRIDSGFCALKRSASTTRDKFIQKRLYAGTRKPGKRLLAPSWSDGFLNCVRDPVRLLVDLVEFLAFDEQANFWLGAGVAEEHTAFAGKFFLDFIHQLHHCRQFGERWFFFHEQVALGLWIFLQRRL